MNPPVASPGDATRRASLHVTPISAAEPGNPTA